MNLMKPFTQMNMTLLPWLTEHTPAGSSTRNVLHFLQSVGTDRLQAYDFGRSGNREKYGQESPPEYRVDLVKVPVATYWGQNDWVCSKRVRKGFARRERDTR